MPHEIDYSTGGPAIAYAGETPWHGLGEKLPEGQPIEAWLKAARLEWGLRRLPVNAVTYYVDHVRTGSGPDRLDSAWFGTGATIKEKAWVKATELVSA
jgi:hypothetical protein